MEDICNDKINHIIKKLIYNTNSNNLIHDEVYLMGCIFHVIRHKLSTKPEQSILENNSKKIISLSLWKINLGYVYNLSVSLLSWKILRKQYWNDFIIRIYVDISVFMTISEGMWNDYKDKIEQKINNKVLSLLLLGSDTIYHGKIFDNINKYINKLYKSENVNWSLYEEYKKLKVFRNILQFKKKYKLNLKQINEINENDLRVYKFMYSFKYNGDITRIGYYIDNILDTGEYELAYKYLNNSKDVYEQIYDYLKQNNLFIREEINITKLDFITQLKENQEKMINKIDKLNLYILLFKKFYYDKDIFYYLAINKYLYSFLIDLIDTNYQLMITYVNNNNNNINFIISNIFEEKMNDDIFYDKYSDLYDEYYNDNIFDQKKFQNDIEQIINLFYEFIRKYNRLVKHYGPLLEIVYNNFDYKQFINTVIKNNINYIENINYISDFRKKILTKIEHTDDYKSLFYKITIKEDVDWYLIFNNLLIDPNFEIWLYNCNWGVDENCIQKNTFGSLIRFQPIFDKKVNICVIRNLELLTSSLDRKYYEDWITSNTTIFNYSFAYKCTFYKNVCGKQLENKQMVLASININKQTNWFINNKIDKKMWNCIKYLFHKKLIGIDQSLVNNSMKLLSNNNIMPSDFYNFHFGVDEVILSICLGTQIEEFMKNIIENTMISQKKLPSFYTLIDKCEISLVLLYNNNSNNLINNDYMKYILEKYLKYAKIKFSNKGKKLNDQINDKTFISKLFAICVLELVNHNDLKNIFGGLKLNTNNIKWMFNYEYVNMVEIFPAQPFKNKLVNVNLKNIHKSIKFYLKSEHFNQLSKGNL